MHCCPSGAVAVLEQCDGHCSEKLKSRVAPMEAAETRPSACGDASVASTDPSGPAAQPTGPAARPKKPAASRRRRDDLRDGHCCCCVARLPPEEGKWRRVDLAKIVNIEGDVPRQFYTCSKPCSDDFRPTKLDSASVRAVVARISDALSPHLRTTIRAGHKVYVANDFSPGRYVQEGVGTVEKLHYHSRSRAVTLTVKTVNGTYQVGLSGIKETDKENGGPGAASTATSRQPLRPTRATSNNTAASSWTSPSSLSTVSSSDSDDATALRREVARLRRRVEQLQAAKTSQQSRAVAAEHARDEAHADALDAEVAQAQAEEARIEAERK